MKANELRIRNWVMNKGVHVQIEEITPNTVSYCFGTYTLDFVEPIPLNEEFLLRFGIEKMHDGNYWTKKLCIRKDRDEFYALYEQGRIYIQHVHQLQNLYFALTGEELTYGGNEQ